MSHAGTQRAEVTLNSGMKEVPGILSQSRRKRLSAQVRQAKNETLASAGHRRSNNGAERPKDMHQHRASPLFVPRPHAPEGRGWHPFPHTPTLTLSLRTQTGNVA